MNRVREGRGRDVAGVVRIEPISEAHADRVQILASDPAIGATSNVPSPYPPDGARKWIAQVKRECAEGVTFAFALIEPGEGLVGVCSLLDVDRELREAALGYWIGRPYWGRGFATSGARAVLDFGFRERRLASVHALSLVGNVASCRVLENLGFVRRGAGPDLDRGATVVYELSLPAGRKQR